MAPLPRRGIKAELHYRNPAAALHWLTTAFRLDTQLEVRDPHGRLVLAEIGQGSQSVAIVPERPGLTVSPQRLDGVSTNTIHFQITGDIDSHFSHARAAGARILSEPQTALRGERRYLVRDSEGHVWCFSQPAPADFPLPVGWRATPCG